MTNNLGETLVDGREPATIEDACDGLSKLDLATPTSTSQIRLSIGQHLRSRRHSLGLLQREVAERLGVCIYTIQGWECGKSVPSVRYVPVIVQFLGYDPFANDSQRVSDRLATRRRELGWTQTQTAQHFGVRQSMVARWEAGRAVMDWNNRVAVARFVGLPEDEVAREYGSKWRREHIK